MRKFITVKRKHKKTRNPKTEGTELRRRQDNHELTAPDKKHRKHKGLDVNQMN